MIIFLNGPLGIGKSTLAEALAESIDGCVMLDGDYIAAANPAYADEMEHLHSTIALLVSHHQRFGYRHFVINHIWRSAAGLEDLRSRLAAGRDEFRSFLLTLPVSENMRRIERRAGTRAIDELGAERETVLEEREILAANSDGSIGELFDVSAPPAKLVEIMLRHLNFPSPLSAPE